MSLPCAHTSSGSWEGGYDPILQMRPLRLREGRGYHGRAWASVTHGKPSETWLFSHLAVCPWGSHCPSLDLSFPNYKLEIRAVFTAQRVGVRIHLRRVTSI